MSWSVGFEKPVPKAEADAAIDALVVPVNVGPECLDQLRSAKSAAKALLSNISGPYILVNLSGHANGVGWQKKAGWANDCICVSVTQICGQDLAPSVGVGG